MDQASVVMAINIEKNVCDFYYIGILFPLGNFNVVKDTKFSKKKQPYIYFRITYILKKKSLEKIDGNCIKIIPLGKKIKSILCLYIHMILFLSSAIYTHIS